MCTVDPWKTWVWIVLVHLHMGFFNSKYYGTTWSRGGWIQGYRTMDMENDRKLYLDFQLQEVLAPLTPASFKGQLYLEKMSIFCLIYVSKLHNAYPDFPMYPVAYSTCTSRLFKRWTADLKLHLSSSFPIPSPLSIVLFHWIPWLFCFPSLSTFNPVPPLKLGTPSSLLPQCCCNLSPGLMHLGSCDGLFYVNLTGLRDPR